MCKKQLTLVNLTHFCIHVYSNRTIWYKAVIILYFILKNKIGQYLNKIQFSADNLLAASGAWWPYISSGLNGSRGQHIITSDEYGGEPLDLHWRTARNDNHLSSGASSGSRTRSHLKVVSETEAVCLQREGATQDFCLLSHELMRYEHISEM